MSIIENTRKVAAMSVTEYTDAILGAMRAAMETLPHIEITGPIRCSCCKCRSLDSHDYALKITRASHQWHARASVNGTEVWVAYGRDVLDALRTLYIVATDPEVQ